MIETSYIGMRIGSFSVIEYRLDKDVVILKVLCNKCMEYKYIKLSYEKVTRVKCKYCGRLDVVVPVSYYMGTHIVNDSITIGAYWYLKMKKEYRISSKDISEIEFIRRMYYKQ